MKATSQNAMSLGDMLRRTVRRFPDRAAMLAPEKSGFREIKYRELFETARQYAGAVRALGVTRGQTLCLLSENCPEWAFLDWSCQCMGVGLVPIYPTLPADQVGYIVGDCGARVVVVSTNEQLAKVKDLDGVRGILLSDLDLSSPVSETDFEKEIDATKPEDLSTIIYTSGTTGLPKGAMMPHRSFVHVCEVAKGYLPLNENDVFLTFLPMSHVYERVAGQCLPICLGATIAFAKSLASLAGDMAKVRPTVLLCVPRFLESFRERALDGVKKLPPLRQKCFTWHLDRGSKRRKGSSRRSRGCLISW